MGPAHYRDLAEFGLPLVTPRDPGFPGLVRDIESRPQPFGSRPIGEGSEAAVMLNQSGKAIVALAYVWRYTMVEGPAQTSRHSNLGSSMQLDVLNGRAPVVRDLGSFILPGSKRLITEHGMFGNNLDVLPPEQAPHTGGYMHMGSGGGGGFRNRMNEGQVAEIELCLDLAIFEDGLSVGPDDSGLFDQLTEARERQRTTAKDVVTAIRNGASDGQVFEIIKPLARRTPMPLLQMFANIAIHRLVHASSSELLHWFERAAEAPSFQLRRPA